MSKLIKNSLSAERIRGCVFAENFENNTAVVDNGGTITSAPIINFSMTTDGTDDQVSYPLVKNVKSVSFWITLASTTEDIMQLSSSHSIEVSTGTITVTGFTNPTIYVNGSATSTITTDRSFVTIVTDTAFDADDIVVGADDSFGEFTIEQLKVWNDVLTIQEISDYYNNAAFIYESKAVIDLAMGQSEHNPSGDNNLGDNLVTNGTFDTDTDWTKGTGWSISGGVASCNGSQASATSIFQTNVSVSGATYDVTYDLTVTAGTFRVILGSSAFGSNKTSSGTYTDTITADGTTLFLQGVTADFVGTVDNVTCKLHTPATKDRSGNGNNATLGDGTTTTTFPTKLTDIKGYSSDGGDYLDVGDKLNSISGSITVVYWIKSDSIGTNLQLSICNSNASPIANDGFCYGIEDRLGRTNAFLGAVATDTTAPSRTEAVDNVFFDNKWTHVICTYNPTDLMNVYINGQKRTTVTVQAGTGNFVNSVIDANLFRATDGTNPLTGDLGGMLVFDFGLTPIQAYDLYQKERNKFNDK